MKSAPNYKNLLHSSKIYQKFRERILEKKKSTEHPSILLNTHVESDATRGPFFEDQAENSSADCIYNLEEIKSFQKLEISNPPVPYYVPIQQKEISIESQNFSVEPMPPYCISHKLALSDSNSLLENIGALSSFPFPLPQFMEEGLKQFNKITEDGTSIESRTNNANASLDSPHKHSSICQEHLEANYIGGPTIKFDKEIVSSINDPIPVIEDQKSEIIPLSSLHNSQDLNNPENLSKNFNKMELSRDLLFNLETFSALKSDAEKSQSSFIHNNNLASSNIFLNYYGIQNENNRKEDTMQENIVQMKDDDKAFINEKDAPVASPIIESNIPNEESKKLNSKIYENSASINEYEDNEHAFKEEAILDLELLNNENEEKEYKKNTHNKKIEISEAQFKSNPIAIHKEISIIDFYSSTNNNKLSEITGDNQEKLVESDALDSSKILSNKKKDRQVIITNSANHASASNSESKYDCVFPKKLFQKSSEIFIDKKSKNNNPDSLNTKDKITLPKFVDLSMMAKMIEFYSNRAFEKTNIRSNKTEISIEDGLNSPNSLKTKIKNIKERKRRQINVDDIEKTKSKIFVDSSSDSRYLYFIKKILDINKKEVKKFSRTQTKELIERGRKNKADLLDNKIYKVKTQKDRIEIQMVADSTKDEIQETCIIERIDRIKEIKPVEFDRLEFEYAVYKYRDNFKKISELMQLNLKEVILMYYLNINTIKYMTDEFISMLVKKEWNEYDKLIFQENFRKYNKKFEKYRMMTKSSREIKIYHRYLMMNYIPPGWTREERALFSQLYFINSKNWNGYGEKLKNKTIKELRGFYISYFKLLDDEEREAEASYYIDSK